MTHKFSQGGKHLVRGKLDGVLPSGHCSKINGNIPNQINPDGIIGKWWINGLPDSVSAHINHYRTKTLSEFINQKIQRGDVVFENKRLNLNYFWECNTKTPEKLKYLKDKGIK